MDQRTDSIPPLYPDLPGLGQSNYLPQRQPSIMPIESNPTIGLSIPAPPYVSFNGAQPREARNSSVTKTSSKKRRNRLSFVCQACRLAKSKCDKEKPECSRCDKLGIECIYDTAIQPAPKHLSKDATILRLENEVDYWQKKTKLLLDEQSYLLEQKHNTRGDISKRQESLAETKTKKGKHILENTVIETSNGPINSNDDFYKQKIQLSHRNARMIMSRVMKREVNPLSPNYLVINDAFFAITLMSIFIIPQSLKSKPSNDNNICLTSSTDSNNINDQKSKPSVTGTDHATTKNTNSKHAICVDHLVSALTIDISISRTHQALKSNLLKLKKILLDECGPVDKKQINKVNNFCDRIIQSTGTSDVNNLLKIWMNPETNDHLEDIVNFDFDETDSSKLKDHYSPLLKEIIDLFEDSFPPLSVVNSYKQHFFENIYALFPFVDLRTFQDCIAEVLVADPNNPRKCKLNLGKEGIRNKLENVCILACILKISYMFLTMLEESELLSQNQFDICVSLETLHNYPIKNEIIVDVLRSITSENWAKCPNENIVSILLYMWAFFVFSPDEGDFFACNPTEFLCDLVVMLSTAIGLHRDPNDYIEIRNDNDKRLKNHRRLLWLSVISMSSYENALKGRRVSIKRLLDSFIDTSSPSAFDNYMTRVKEDLVPGCQLTIFTTSLHELAWRRTNLALLHQHLNGLTTSYHKPVELWDIEKAMSSIDAYFKKHVKFNLDNVEVAQLKGSRKVDIYQLSIITTRPSLYFISDIMGKNLQVRTAYALMIYFENPDFDAVDKEGTEKYDERIIMSSKKQLFLPHYLRYLKMTINNCLSLIQLYENFYSDSEENFSRKQAGSSQATYSTKDGKNTLRLAPLTKYYVSKILQLSFSTTILTLLVIIVRIAINKLFLTEDNEWGKNDKKIDALGAIQDILRSKLKKIHMIATRYMKYSYFSVFKILSMYDLLLHKLFNDKLMNGLFEPITESDVDPRMVKFFKMSFNIHFSDGNAKLIDLLRDKDHISMIDESDLTQFVTELKSNHRDEADVNLKLELPNDNTIFHETTDSTSAGNIPVDNECHLNNNFVTASFIPPLQHFNPRASMNPNDDGGQNNSSLHGFPNMEMPSNNTDRTSHLPLDEEDIGNFWDEFTPNQEQLSKTFAGIFGDLDIFGYNYFFNNKNDDDMSQNDFNPVP